MNGRESPARRARHKPVVYIIKPARLGYVKIGVTRGICQRLHELQHGSPEPLRVVALFRGWVQLEAKLHYTFARYHTNGEWFRIGRDIAELLTLVERRGFDVERWLEQRDCERPPRDGEIKRYIGGKVRLTKDKGGFGHPDRKRISGRLTEKQARQILENPDGLSNAELGRRFDVSRMMIGKIRNGQAWKHLSAKS